jgi:aryl-alcohol dehydrogenase-like predicted oxidoreductase
METRRIGDRTVGAIGLGAMPMSTRPYRDAARAERTIHAALDAGVRLIDTADAYSHTDADMGHNEQLVGQSVRRWSGDRDAVLIATKGGHVRTRSGGWLVDGRPEHVRAACDASLRNLGVERIGLYQLHRPDPRVPFDESLGALAELQRVGKIATTGVSNADPDQIRTAVRLAGIVSVQNEFGPAFPSAEREVRVCEELELAFLAWSPLGGVGNVDRLAAQFPAFARVAERHNVSIPRVVLAWLLDLSPVVVPLVGASRPETILDSVAAVDLTLSGEDRSELDGANRARVTRG